MILNIINLICWGALLIFAIDHCYKNEPVHPLSYLLAVIVCLFYSIQKFYW